MSSPEERAGRNSDAGFGLRGKRVGNYEVIGELGRGGMGVVYLAEHPEIGTKVAVKVLAAHLSANPQMAGRFMAEARAANLTNHPGIIRVFDFGRLEDDRLYMVMEFLDGVELGDYIAKHAPMALQDASSLIVEIASALDAAHGAGIVHRDLKPSNIFLAEMGGNRIVKLLDFGIAKLFGESLGDVQATRTGVVMGTPLFMAPEQAAGRISDISFRTDIYALGVIAYQMLSGDVPIKGPSAPEILWAHINGVPRHLSEVAPHLPQGVCAAVMQCLEKDPALRPETAGDFARQLVEASHLDDRATGPSQGPEGKGAASLAFLATGRLEQASADEGAGQETGQAVQSLVAETTDGPGGLKFLWVVGGLLAVLTAGGLFWMTLRPASRQAPVDTSPVGSAVPMEMGPMSSSGTDGGAEMSRSAMAPVGEPRLGHGSALPLRTLRLVSRRRGAHGLVIIDGNEKTEAALPMELLVRENSLVELHVTCPNGSSEREQFQVQGAMKLTFCAGSANLLGKMRRPSRRHSRRKAMSAPTRGKAGVEVHEGVLELPD